MSKKMILFLLVLMLAPTVFAESSNTSKATQKKLSKQDLLDKIKGGWAGQTIGVVYGAPTEFNFQGSTIQNYQPLPWSDGYVKYWWDKKPGLFDDIYNDLTFVETLDKKGLNCSMDTLAVRFATPEYHLAHANQASRYNIRHGIQPPASGNWMNNPHADDLDFQIEADFIGLMAPGMINQAMNIADRVGHIMNSGDGFYGGAFVSGMYSTAFVTNDVNEILNTALSTIPAKSQFHQCISDVIKWHMMYPNDWQQCWFELLKKWNKDVGCPKGVFLSFNIDAKMNSAYIALAMLYGNGDFSKSLEIAVRCGQDTDSNAGSLGGILGVLCGYSKIPDFWINSLKQIEPLNFEGTDISLNKAYQMSYKHALELITKNGGKVTDNEVNITIQKPQVLVLEQNFEKTIPICRDRKDAFFTDEYLFDFDGNGFVVYGNLVSTKHVTADYINRVSIRHIGSEVFGLGEPNDNYIAKLEVWIDGKLDRTVDLPMKNTSRRLEPAWKYLLSEGKHQVKLKWLNREMNYLIRINDIIYYSENELTNKYYHN